MDLLMMDKKLNIVAQLHASLQIFNIKHGSRNWLKFAHPVEDYSDGAVKLALKLHEILIFPNFVNDVS